MTLVVPSSERDRFSLLWNPVTSAGDPAVASGEPAVTLRGCDGAPRVFRGGFVTEREYCAPLDVYFGEDPDPVRITVSTSPDCGFVADLLARPETGPVPDVTGLILREARLAIRLVLTGQEWSSGSCPRGQRR